MTLFESSVIPLIVRPNRLLAVATSRKETAEAARAHGGFETATDDWRRVIDRRDIDVVNICSPNTLHAEQLLAAMAAENTTEIRRIYHCDRGYENLSEKLSGLGADIIREKGGKP